MRNLTLVVVGFLVVLSCIGCVCEDGYKTTKISGGGYSAEIPTTYQPCALECHEPGKKHAEGKYSCWCSAKCRCHRR